MRWHWVGDIKEFRQRLRMATWVFFIGKSCYIMVSVSLAFLLLLGLGTIKIIWNQDTTSVCDISCFYLSFFPGDSLRLQGNRRWVAPRSPGTKFFKRKTPLKHHTFFKQWSMKRKFVVRTCVWMVLQGLFLLCFRESTVWAAYKEHPGYAQEIKKPGPFRSI